MTNAEVKTLHDDARATATTARRGVERAAEQAAENTRRAAGDIADTAEMTLDQLREQVAVLKDDLAALARTAGEAGAETARDAMKTVRRAGKTALAAAEDGYDYAGDQLERAVTGAETFTRERPVTALGLAAGAGFLAALYLSRR